MAGCSEYSVFEYSDYRAYLKDEFEFFQSRDRKYTLRFITRELEFSSGFLSLIMQAKRRMSYATCTKICRYLGLTGLETQCFWLLTCFGQATTTKEKEEYWEMIEEVRSSHRAKTYTFATSFTVGLSDSSYRDIRSQMHDLEKEILRRVAGDGGAQQYQINLQILPMDSPSVQALDITNEINPNTEVK